MKRLTALWRVLAHECADMCGTSAVRDVKTVMDRVEVEGESFLTITLPMFGKALERSLELGHLDFMSLPFKKRQGTPLFLGGFLSQIFDPSGVLLDEPSIECIRSIRQLTLVFGKIKRMCSDTRVSCAMQQFIEIEKELEAFDTSSLDELIPEFTRASMFLWADVFSHVENSLLDKHQLIDEWTDYSTSNDAIGSSHKLERVTNGSLQSAHQGDRGIVDPMDIILGIDRRSARFDGFAGDNFVSELIDPTSAYHIVPRHGPGATADRLRGNAKYSVSQWPRRLESVFPYGDYALPQLSHHDELDRVQFLEPGAEVPVKVTPVPKTDKTPRLIAEEPTAMQYMQQALFFQFVYRLEHSDEFPPPLGGKEFDFGKWFVGFADQESNRLLAREGSLDGSLATLDLSEASDRVLNSHVQLLLSRFPRLSEAVQACRSSRADVPGHGVIPLTKFASMGSALCFPMEAMVFTTIVICAIAKERGVPVNRKFLHDLRGKVRVYGDDIVVPVDCVPRVIQFLEAFGLRVNSGKSFWNGMFRESCGGDYYAGEWVTPVRLRNELPQSLDDVKETVGLVAFRNLLYWSGYWKTADVLDQHLKRHLRGNWAIVEKTAAGLGRESALPYQAEWITDTELYEPRVAGAIVRNTIPESPTSGSGSLLKFLIKRGVLPSQDKKHLQRQGRPVAQHIKLQGIRPY